MCDQWLVLGNQYNKHTHQTAPMRYYKIQYGYLINSLLLVGQHQLRSTVRAQGREYNTSKRIETSKRVYHSLDEIQYTDHSARKARHNRSSHSKVLNDTMRRAPKLCLTYNQRRNTNRVKKHGHG